MAGPGTIVLGATDDAAHDEQPEPVLNGAELTPLTPHAPEAHDGVEIPHAPEAHEGA